jgi:mono/diheme cytochrome c family protein
MKTLDGKIRWIVATSGLFVTLPVLAQQAPPQFPPLPPLPPPRIQPAARPVQIAPKPQNGATNQLAQSPLATPPAALPSPALPAPRPPSAAQQLPVVPQPVPQRQPLTALAWDAESKDYAAKAGDTNAYFTFNLTNITSSDVLISSVRTSCGCTVAKLPQQPWTVGPGTNGPIAVTVNLLGKSGTIVKTITVDSSAGTKMLMVKVAIPSVGPVTMAGNMDRIRNAQLALADRQAVFKGECAICHVAPSKGKSGQPLYAAACGICHDAEHRASMVPDLRALKHPTDADYWRKWVASGKPGSLMPAFAQAEGGPLTGEQINSLVDYLAKAVPSNTQTNASAQLNPGVKGLSALPVKPAQ